ncbi:hypothetical protein GALL_304930 [mine drainage metagenome]|uniref:TonB C-terminal domain-containing protein n=1 Tax=mine drainage metagenome TaxID=410659 RepID=A0A1J5RHR1_9ZZZZ
MQDRPSSRFSTDRLPGWLRRLGWGELCSLLLHGLALWWLIAGPSLTPPPPPPQLAVAVALVGDGGSGQGHAAQRAAGAGAAAAPAPAAKSTPAPPPPPPQAAPRAAAPAPHPAPAPRPKAAARPRHKAPPPKPPADDFYSRLKAAERRQKAQPWREAQDGGGEGAAAGGAAGGGGRGHGGGSDIMRAYIARHWNFDLSLLEGGDVEITLYLVVDKLGNVLEARGVATGGARSRHAAEIAASARRAAQVASPLPLPPGHYGDRNALVVHLSTRDVVR